MTKRETVKKMFNEGATAREIGKAIEIMRRKEGIIKTDIKKLESFAKEKGIKDVLLRLKYLVALEDYIADNYPDIYDNAVEALESEDL